MQTVLERCHEVCHEDTKVVIATYNFLWQPMAMLGERWGVKRRQPAQNWLSPEAVDALLYPSGLEAVRTYRFTLCPYRIPLVAPLANNWMGTLFVAFGGAVPLIDIVLNGTARVNVSRV